MRRLATFAMWLGFFGLFLAFAAYSTGELNWKLIGGSVGLLLFAWMILRRPAPTFQPDRRFRTLRKLGLIGKKEDNPE